jgi:hypothetical protein
MTQTSPNEKAGHKPRRMTEIDCQMAEARKTKTVKAVAQEFGVPVSQVQRAERLAWRLKKSREYLDKDPESLAGLEWSEEISSRLGGALRYGDPTAHDKNGNRIRPPLERISDVVGMGRKRIFGFSGMGPKARAELEAFLVSRSLTWSDHPAPGYNVPAGTLGDDWNIIDFPTGKRRLALTTDNMRVRSQYWGLYRGLSNLQDLLCEATTERNHFNRALNKLSDDMNELWLALVNHQIVADDGS